MKQRACFLSCMLLGMALLWCATPAAYASGQTGACCHEDGTCQEVMAFECQGSTSLVSQGGTFLGDGTICLGDNDNDGIDDACDICPDVPNPSQDLTDCNNNEEPDECEILRGDTEDCNENGIPDECDIALSGPIVYFVFETSNDTVYRLQDLNGDGDADDPGEGWAYGAIDSVEGLDVDQRNGDLYTAETGSNLIYRYRDLNGDGDALDDGEKFLYADDDEAGVSPDASLENIALDESTNTVYTVYEDEDLVVWHRDMNGDGDALDDGESGEFANVGYDLEEITVDASTGDVYVGDAEDDDVFRLVDVNGDGDAMDPEDIQESVGQLGHEALDFNDNTGELFAGDEDFGHFHRLLGAVENVYGELDCCAEALAVDPIGGDVFTGDEPQFASNGIIWKFSDLNGNGDANDDGERTLFHQFLFDENSESETEALAVFGGIDIDANDNGIPDECEVASPPPGVPLVDECPNDPNKTEPGECGCGIPDVDSDEDGVLDCKDNCPDVVNPQQEDGDDDTVGDLCDNSPNEPNADQADADEDGIGDLSDNCPNEPNVDQEDSDEDGIGDLCDECPNDAAKADPGICGCGVADTDVDEDGIPDCIDNCPDDANADQADADGDGIGDACDSTPTPPAPAPVPPPAAQNPPQNVGPLCTFCGIGCPQMMIMSFLGLAMMGFVQRRRRF